MALELAREQRRFGAIDGGDADEDVRDLRIGDAVVELGHRARADQLAEAPKAPALLGNRHREQRLALLADLGALSDEELKELIDQLTTEEQEVSYQRRILHGKIDILRAELVNRLRKKNENGEDLISGADVQRLTDILAGRSAAQE